MFKGIAKVVVLAFSLTALFAVASAQADPTVLTVSHPTFTDASDSVIQFSVSTNGATFDGVASCTASINEGSSEGTTVVGGDRTTSVVLQASNVGGADVTALSVVCPVEYITVANYKRTDLGGGFAARNVTPLTSSGGCLVSHLAGTAAGDENTRCVGARAQLKYHATPPDSSYLLTGITHNVLSGIHGCRNSGWVSSQRGDGRATALFHQESRETQISQCDVVSVTFRFQKTTENIDPDATGSWPAE